VRLPTLQGDGEYYRITCEAGIGVCRDKAREVCASGFEVLETAGTPIQTPRITTAPGPRTTGPRYERAKWMGQMVVECIRGDRVTQAAPSSPMGTNVEDSAASPGPNQLCIPGVTVECLGPGACRGAQACLPDGRGYGPCDCGEGASSRAPKGAHSSTEGRGSDAGSLEP
jgi:hypothetical protein